MDMQGSQVILSPVDAVWAALLDAEVLRQCVPGCEDLTGDADQGFAATVVQRVGPVKATFRGEVRLADRDPPRSLTLQGEGKGGVAGFARGGARVTLAEQGDDTLLSYVVEAQIGGKLAQLGSRIIDSFARKMADQFFERFKGVVERQSTEI